MSFISYAQNFEDVMLWRALKHVDKGFYIDIGAQDPIIDSVSRAFYEHGWRGVHVEPTQQYSDKLRTARPDETVLQVAIGNQVGTLTFYEFENTGLSTADSDIAHRHRAAGFRSVETLVPVISLDILFERFGARDIHWLKLDVEGLEKAVLESWKHSHVLPWILVIESTRPLTQDQSHEEWEQLLLDKGYRYVYFDGLNRFYVASDHFDLSKKFATPPNIFDDFSLSGSASQPFGKLVESRALQAEARAEQTEAKAHQAEARAQQAEARAQQAEARAQQAEMRAQAAEAKAEHAETQVQQLHHELHAVFDSRSWRITAPLRWCRLKARHLRGLGFPARLKIIVKTIARPFVRRCVTFVGAHPVLREQAVVMAQRLGLYQSLRLIAWRFLDRGQPPLSDQPTDLAQLTPRERAIYAELKAAVKNKQDSR